MSTTYRALEPSDAHAVADLALQTGLMPWHPEVHATMDFYHALREQDQGRAVGAFIGGRLVGALMLRCVQHRRRTHSASLYLGVHPDWRNRGIGAELLRQAFRLADWMQIGRLETGVYTFQAETAAFYARHGFHAAVQQKAALLLGHEPFDRTVFEHLRPTFAWKPSQRPRPPVARAERRPGHIEVRTSTVDDAGALCSIVNSDAVLWGTLQIPWGSEALWRGRFSDPDAQGLMALADSLPVACGSLHSRVIPGHLHAWSLGMSVHADYHGLGIGSRLLKSLLELADEKLAAQRVELEVYTDNPHAQALYARCGFVVEGERQAESWRYDGYANTLAMARLTAARSRP